MHKPPLRIQTQNGTNKCGVIINRTRLSLLHRGCLSKDKNTKRGQLNFSLWKKQSGVWGFRRNTTYSCHLSIISLREAIQSPCSAYTIRLIVAMSDRQSAAADIIQTQQSGHHHRDNKSASLILKRKRLWSKGRGPFFFYA